MKMRGSGTERFRGNFVWVDHAKYRGELTSVRIDWSCRCSLLQIAAEKITLQSVLTAGSRSHIFFNCLIYLFNVFGEKNSHSEFLSVKI